MNREIADSNATERDRLPPVVPEADARFKFGPGGGILTVCKQAERSSVRLAIRERKGRNRARRQNKH